MQATFTKGMLLSHCLMAEGSEGKEKRSSQPCGQPQRALPKISVSSCLS